MKIKTTSAHWGSYYPKVKNKKLISLEPYEKDENPSLISEGMIDASERADSEESFWELFEDFNDVLLNFLEEEVLNIMIDEIVFLIHNNKARLITNKYLA